MPSFDMDIHEVSNAEYRAFLSAVGSGPDPRYDHPAQPATKPGHVPHGGDWDQAGYNRDDQPVVNVDWFDAYAYARWAASACRRPRVGVLRSRQRRPLVSVGQHLRSDRLRHQPTSGHGAGRPRGVRGRASPEGVHHLVGNVAEWVHSERPPEVGELGGNTRGGS